RHSPSGLAGRGSGAAGPDSPITIHEQAKKKPWPPWRLIATHANSEIAATHSQQTTSHFLTATRSLFSESPPRTLRYLLTTTFSSLAFGSRSVIFVVFFERIIIRLSHSEKTPFEYARTSYWPVIQRANWK